MKLIDLLVKELQKRGGWPDGVVAMAQDADGAVQNYKDTRNIHIFESFASGESRIAGSYSIDDYEIPCASDRLTAIVTRSQYESALAASEGWIEWGGGECPVDEGEIVDLKDRDGYLWLGAEALLSIEAKAEFWRHTDVRAQSSDIIAYRLHKPDINSRANDDRMEQDLNECIGQQIPPVEWSNGGLPLVGVNCEMADENGNFKKVEIIAWRNKCAIGWDSGRLITYISNNPKDFRPLRTEAERARDAAIKAIKESYYAQDKAGNYRGEEGVFDDIAAGKIPGVNLEGK